MMMIGLLPNELLIQIFEECHPHAIWHRVLRGVCTRWSHLLPPSTRWRKRRGDSVCAFFASQRALSCLQWARGQGCPWDENTCANAARRGHLEMLKWARSQGCPWGKWTCANAARRGHLLMLQWARRQGCPWDDLTCSNAARGGHLQVLQWARSQGCHWNEGTMRWCCSWRPFEGVAMGQRARLSLG